MILTAGNFRRTALNIYAFLVLRKNGETAVLAVVGATTAFLVLKLRKKKAYVIIRSGVWLNCSLYEKHCFIALCLIERAVLRRSRN